MPNKIALTLNKTAIRAFRPVPAQKMSTLPLDNGKEFAAHEALSEALELDIYFAHLYHTLGNGGSTSTRTGFSGSTSLKRSPLIPLPKNSLTESLLKSIIVLARF